MENILEDVNLLKKYDVYAFDYIEYPHKSAWKTECTDDDVRHALSNLVRQRPDNPVLLYIHIPFCEQLCWFCICHREITSNQQKIHDYLETSLYREFDLLRALFKAEGRQPNIREIYLGGGTPTAIGEADFDRLLENLKGLVDITSLDTVTMEVDPRRVDADRLRFYHSRGVNKLSLGIQDFDPVVQQAVNRIQPPEMIEALLQPDIRDRFPSINFDLLIGLPHQTPASVRATMERVVAMSPDRISLTYVHYGPKFHPHQVHMNRSALLPDFYERKRLFIEALDVLAGTDYVRTGFEHFARPRDPVARAVLAGKAYYNSFGATTGDCVDIIATGRASYSTIGDEMYVQWVYDQDAYRAALADGRFPVLRGHRMTADDVLRRDIIKTMRTYFRLDIPALESRHGIDFFHYFAKEIAILLEFAGDGLVELRDDHIVVTELGRHFSNLVGSIFDIYVTEPRFRAGIPTRGKAAPVIAERYRQAAQGLPPQSEAQQSRGVAS